MAFGELIGMNIVSDAAGQEGPAGDMAGAAGALMILICMVAGFVMTTLTLIVTKLLRRYPPDQIVLRLGVVIVGGGIIGALSSISGEVSTLTAWLILICLPILLVWPWRGKVTHDEE